MINHVAKLKTATIDITMIAITPPLTVLVFEGFGSSCPDGFGDGDGAGVGVGVGVGVGGGEGVGSGEGVGVGGFPSAHNPS